METTAVTIFEAPVRKNSNGGSMGRRLSFVQDIAGGDIRKHLKNTGLKGKKLTRAVDRVLRGDSSLGWAAFEASVSMARSQGFVPTVADMNKRESRMKIQLERPTTVYDREEVMDAAANQLSKEDLLSIIKAQEDKAKAKAIDVQSTTSK